MNDVMVNTSLVEWMANRLMLSTPGSATELEAAQLLYSTQVPLPGDVLARMLRVIRGSCA